ncbi:MAG: PHP domain-containing protein [Candidatus Falkowbacteria bacterium]|nr:PHP domain-containing protein [Candidatus Falkowbacteria bacterium]
MKIDLQLHSTYSDGYMTPTELANFLVQNKVKVAALTDHNTVAGQHEFKHACRKLKLKYIIGIELYVKLNTKKFNILWYNLDASSPLLHKMLVATQIRRKAKVRKHLNILVDKFKFKLDIEKILDKYHHYLSINHIIDDILAIPKNRAIVKKVLGTNSPREIEIIKEFFYNKKLNHVMAESYINIGRILKMRKNIGGQIILNHPGKNNSLKKDLLIRLKKLGFDGIEVLSPHHSIGSIMYAQFIARELDFITTGGSDFHRLEGGKYLTQSSNDYFNIDSDQLRGVGKIIDICGI